MSVEEELFVFERSESASSKDMIIINKSDEGSSNRSDPASDYLPTKDTSVTNL